MIEAALEAARGGWRVFPCVPLSKEPLVRFGSEATTDERALREWWRKWPDANLAVACTPSNLVVVDVDTKDGKRGKATLSEIEALNGRLPLGLLAITASGGGHLFLRGQARSSNGGLGEGLDIKSDRNQYVLLAPSVVLKDNEKLGAYRWTKGRPGDEPEAPEWFVAECASVSRGGSSGSGPVEQTPVVEWDLPRSVELARAWVRRHAPICVQGEGGGDILVKVVAAKLKDFGVSIETAFELLTDEDDETGLSWNERCEPPWEIGDDAPKNDSLHVKLCNGYLYCRNHRPGVAVAPPPVEEVAADFPEDLDDGDDWLLYGAVGRANMEARLASAGNPYAGPAEEFVWVNSLKRFVRRLDPIVTKWDREQFDAFYTYLSEGKLSTLLVNKCAEIRKVERLCYRPGEGEFPDGLDKNFTGQTYNLYRPASVARVTGGAPWFVEHVRYLLDEREAGLLMDWLAWRAQNPGRRPNFGVILRGAQGTGKSFIGLAMRAVLGEHNVAMVDNEEVHGDYTSWIEAKQMVVVEELKAKDVHGARDLANKLKPLITQPTTRIREKYIAHYEVENLAAFLCFTNHEDALNLEDGDRRWMVLFSEAEPRDQAYYRSLFRRLADPRSVGGMLDELLSRDVSAFDGEGRAPDTEAKETMREAGMGRVERMALELARDRLPPCDRPLFTAEDVVGALPTEETAKHRNPALLMRNVFRTAGATSLGQVRRGKNGRGGTYRLWTFDAARFKGESPSVLAREYEATRSAASAEMAGDGEATR
jgi:hypothetical protein